MNKYHKEILIEIERHAGQGTSQKGDYHGTTHHFYHISVPVKRQIARNWAAEHKNLTQTEFEYLLDSLYRGQSYEEKTVAGLLLERFPKLRRNLVPQKLDEWLDHLEGWAEIDGLCQSNFTADEMLDNWQQWSRLIKKFAKDKHISKRRAALVLLTGTVVRSPDKQLADLAFEIIDTLKEERDNLITKAISWLLRDLTKNHHTRVEAHLTQNRSTLPPIAVREVTNKMQTLEV